MSSSARIINYGVQGFRRNVWLSLIAIITMVLTIVTMTVFLVANVAATAEYRQENNKLDYKIFIKDSASDADTANLRKAVDGRAEVTKSQYITKEEALKTVKSNPLLLGDAGKALSETNNPLPREIDVRFADPHTIAGFNTFINSAQFTSIVDYTSYQSNEDAITGYLKLVNFVRVFGIAFTIFFIMIAVVVILNTIRLTIFSRRDEIEVMRLVGATSSFIRGPFLIEGMLFGVIGALVASIISWLCLYQLQKLLGLGVTNATIQTLAAGLGYLTDQAQFNRLFAQLFALQLLVGIGLGTICSAIAIRRYLRE